jgi:hypothetical protein
MRTLFLLTAAAAIASAQPAYMQPLRFTVPGTAGSVTTATIPFGVTGATLKDRTHGGPINSDCSDVALWTNAALTTPATWYLDKCDATNGYVSGYYRPTLAAGASESVVYLSYGDAARTTSTAGAASTVFDAAMYLVAYGFGTPATVSLADQSGNGRTLTVNTCTAAAGAAGGGLACNGTNQYASTPTNSSLEPATFHMSVWVKLNGAAGSNSHIITKDPRGSPPYIAYDLTANLNGGGRFGLQLGAGGSLAECQGTTVAVVGTWYHILATYTNGAAYLRINGALEANCAISGALSYTQHSPLYIGGDPVLGTYFNGVIDDFQMVDLAHGSADWTLFFANPAPGPETRPRWTATAGAQTRYNDQALRTSHGDTMVMATAADTTRYVSINDGNGFITGGVGTCSEMNMLLAKFTTPYTLGANINCMADFGTWNQLNVPASCSGDSKTWKSAGLAAITDAQRTDQILWWTFRQWAGAPWTSDKPFLMRSLDHGATWCNPAHSTGIATCAITPAAAGDVPSCASTPTMGTWSKYVKPRFVQFEAGHTGANSFEGNNLYLYVYASDSTNANVYLGRCDRTLDCTQSGTWRAYIGAIGGDPASAGNWSASDASATALLSGSALPMGTQAGPIYAGPPMGYLMAASIGFASDFTNWILRADSLTGPWQLIGIAPGGLATSPNFPTLDLSSVSRAGNALTVQLINTGDATVQATLNYSLFWRTITLTAPAPRH